jgi:TolA-binding protein
MKMRAILLATVAGVLLTGNAFAESRSIRHPDDLALARKDVNIATIGKLADQVQALRQQLRATEERAELRMQQMEQMENQARRRYELLQNAIKADVSNAQEQIAQIRNGAGSATDGASARPLETTNSITLTQGHAVSWTAPRPFKTVVPGNSEIADAINGEADNQIIIVAKQKDGFTNFVMLDDKGKQVANLEVRVGTPESVGHPVRIHNKKDNPAGYTNYQCADGHCFRRDDKMEGSDRAPPAGTIINLNIGGGNSAPAK